MTGKVENQIKKVEELISKTRQRYELSAKFPNLTINKIDYDEQEQQMYSSFNPGEDVFLNGLTSLEDYLEKRDFTSAISQVENLDGIFKESYGMGLISASEADIINQNLSEIYRVLAGKDY